MKKGEKKWYKSPSNWVTIVAGIILVPILLINLFIIFQSKANQDAVPSIFGFKPFIVLSGSMESNIHKGDLIITKTVNPENLKVDDVIAFRDSAGTVTTHRIIDIVEQNGSVSFITKGDNNNTQDRNLVSLDAVEGLYIGRIPGIGSLMDSLAQPTTILMLVFGITAIFVIGFAISTKKEREIEKQEFLEYKLMKEQQEKEYHKKNVKERESSIEEVEPEEASTSRVASKSRLERLQSEENSSKKFEEDDDEYLEYLLKKEEAKLEKLREVKKLQKKRLQESQVNDFDEEEFDEDSNN